LRRNNMAIISSKPDFLPELHALRGMGIVCIVLFHLAPVGGVLLPGELKFIGTFFGSPVILFFALSGFSLYHTTSSKVDTHDWIGNFYIKRFFRIAPLFYLALVLNLAWIVIHWNASVDLNTLLVNVLFIFNLFPGMHESYVMAGWLIGIEAVFYAFFPILLVTVRKRPARAILMLLFLAWLSATARTWFSGINGLSPTYPYMNFLTQSISFGAGAACYVLFDRLGVVRKRCMAYPFLIGFALCVFLIVTSQHWVIIIQPVAVHVPLFSFGFGLLTLSLLSGALPFLTNRLTLVLGELSYSIYLLHPLVLATMKPAFKFVTGNFAALPAYLICAMITLFIVVPLSYVTYRLVEQKGMMLGKKIIAARVS
jgi:peptidoglycan/LPS O-acetylase OafA/YrhL